MSPPQISAGDVPRRRMDRDTTPGRCNNLDYCSLGMQRVLVQVPISLPFVCPECGRALRAPESLFRARRPRLLPTLRLAVLAVGMAAALAAGYTIGRVGPVVAASADAATRAVLARLQPSAPSASSLPQPVAAAPAAPVQGRAYPARLGPVETAVPPAHLAHEVRFGQVTVDCERPAQAIQAVCHVADTRGGDAFSAAAIAWLQRVPVRYAPAPDAPDHRWRVIFEDFEGQQRPAP